MRVFALIALVLAGLVLPTSALAVTGQITRADASPDWTHGSIAGFASEVGAYRWRFSVARAYVVPNGAVCFVTALPNPNPSLGVELVWESGLYEQNPSFDLPDVPLNSGISPQLCLYAGLYNIYLPTGSPLLLANTSFAVPSPPSTPQPLPPPPKTAAVTLSRAAAYTKAKSALRARFGRVYRRGKRKRLSCAKQSSTRYRCTFSFRYRKKLRKGTVTVAIQPDGSVTMKIRRRDAHAGS
jgi:hypothetical protein